MRLETIRLISTDPNGIGNTGNGAINFIYSYMLQKYKLDFYWLIKINQIGDPELENTFFEGQKVHINHLFKVNPNFAHLDESSKNRVRLKIIHEALKTLTEKDSRFKHAILDQIHEEILSKEFDFEIDYVVSPCPGIPETTIAITVHPMTLYFDIFLIVRKGGSEAYRSLLYRGKPTDYYIDQLFANSRWINSNEFTITGPQRQITINFRLTDSLLQFQNLTEFTRPPFWEMMKFHNNQDDERSAYEKWLESLPPGYGAILTNSQN